MSHLNQYSCRRKVPALGNRTSSRILLSLTQKSKVNTKYVYEKKKKEKERKNINR